jgi:cyclase
MGANHTRGDTAMYVEPDGVLFSGDVVMTALPGLGSPYSTIKQWQASMQRFEQLKPRTIVPSHGPLGGTPMIATYQTFLRTVQARAAELKKQGRTLEEAEKTMTAELSAQYPGGRLAGSIRAAYNEAN